MKHGYDCIKKELEIQYEWTQKWAKGGMQFILYDMHYKRRRFRSSTMKRCMFCGSQKRLWGKKEKDKLIEELAKKETKSIGT